MATSDRAREVVGGGLNQEFDGGMPNVAVLAQAMADANEIISISKCKALSAI